MKAIRELARSGLGGARWLAQLGSTTLRVGWQTGTIASIRPAGALAMARARFRPNPSTVLRIHAAKAPAEPAIVAGARTISYGEFDALADRVAMALESRGLGRGDAVALMLRNVPEFLILQIGVGRLGARAVSVSYRSSAKELEYFARHSGARVVFFDPECAPVVREALSSFETKSPAAFATGGNAEGFESYEELLASAARASRNPSADRGQNGAVVVYTSGTTGKPKGAVRTFGLDNVLALLSFVGETPMRVGQTHLTVCPLYHSTAFAFAHLSFVLGAKVVLLDGFDPEGFLDALERHGVHHTAVVPTMLHRLLELGPQAIRRRDTSQLEAIFVGGAPLGSELCLAVMDALGDKLFNFYGATETGFVTIAGPTELRQAPGTIGRAVPGNEVRLLDDSGSPCADDEVGELYVRSGNLTCGYHGDTRATDAAMRDGFFSVGDLARRDGRGRYFLVGRRRDLIISGGENVYPVEVEAALLEHPAVSEAAVVGSADPEWGERVRAFVVARPGMQLDPAELVAYCHGRLAGPKRPREVRVLDELPRTATGKVLKRELAQR